MDGFPVRVPVRAYLAVWIVMEALLAASIAVSRLHLGPWDLVIELILAATMQALVILVYMHVIWSENLVRLFLVAGYFWLSIMFVLIAADYATRFGYTSIISRPGPPFNPPRVLQPWSFPPDPAEPLARRRSASPRAP